MLQATSVVAKGMSRLPPGDTIAIQTIQVLSRLPDLYVQDPPSMRHGARVVLVVSELHQNATIPYLNSLERHSSRLLATCPTNSP
jgi:hypothetical protein